MLWEWVRLAGDVMFLLAATSIGTFTLLYVTRSRWRVSPAGRATLAFTATVFTIMVVAITFGLVESFNDTGNVRLVFRVILYGTLLGVSVRYIIVLLNAQGTPEEEHVRGGRLAMSRVMTADRRKIFGRDPLLWTALVTGLVTAVATFWIGLDAGAAGAINGVVVAGVALYATRPRTPGLFTGTVAAVVSLLAEYGVDLTDTQVTTVNGVVLAALALLTRQQVDPRETKISKA